MSSPPAAPSPGDKKRDLVVRRLRSRLVERRAAELVEGLRRRHGETWTQHVLRGGFHADEAMRRMCEAFGLRPELELRVLRLALRHAEVWPSQVPLASPSSSEDDGPDGPGRRSEEAENLQNEDLLLGPWRSWTREVLTPLQPEELEDRLLSERLREAMANAERSAATLKEVPELQSPCHRKGCCIGFSESEICFFTIGGDGADGEEYQRKLQTKEFDGPSGHRARKGGYSWCDEDSDSDCEGEDWREQCDEMAELMSQHRQMVLWSGSW